MKPTMTRRLPCLTSASRIASHSGVVGASGFSHITGLPAAIEASVYSACVSPIEQTRTASTRSLLMSEMPLSKTLTSGPSSAATCSARARLTSVTALTVEPLMTLTSLFACSVPMRPVPMTPTRIVME